MKKYVPILAQLFLVVAILLTCYPSFGQGRSNQGKKEVPPAALEHIKKNKQKLDLTDEEIADLELSSETASRHNGVRHLYIKQLHQGIEIHGAITNMSMTTEGKVINMGNRFHKEVGKKVKSNKAGLSAAEAVAAAAGHLNTSIKEPLSIKERGNEKKQEVTFGKGGISLEPITAKLVYQPMEDGSLRLAWEISIYELDALNWWIIRVDANTGSELSRDNLVTHCNFENDGPGGQFLHYKHDHSDISLYRAKTQPQEAANAAVTNGYSVFAMPLESPNHGPRSVVSTSAAHADASPNGWHIETRTRGNNVFAYEDPTNNNDFRNNYSPDGGANLSFDFPVDFKKEPETYKDAAITNLFYWNNIIHDVWYLYGFDEASGSFQLNNYNKGGLGGDPVLAEAQDARIGDPTATPPRPASRNNANFATPIDGRAPRMQMYLWNGIPDKDLFRVTAPASIAGSYTALEAIWSKKLTSTPVTGKLVLAETADANSAEGCSAFTNSAAVAGNIAVVYRGSCGFAIKAEHAQAAGAIALIVINNAPGAPITMAGTPAVTIEIPAVMISQADGKLIRDLLDANASVNIALKNDGSGPEFDGDFDNGIITHEYGHGISNRLTGGPMEASCLASAYRYSDGSIIYTEQMGEGWSDWFALMMTMRAGDTAEKARGIGTYASAEPTTGKGIRPAPYSTDFGINNYTYAATNNPAISAPHGVGFVWSTMLWDLTWAMIDRYGYDEDIYRGKGGNNMTMQLVIDGLKMQACNPGFVDGRDAILAADQVNYNGANQELIWRVFAKRGLGYSASQGSTFTRFDQKQAFDLPPVYACDAPVITVTPTSNVFTGGNANTIYLGYGPKSVRLTASGDPTFTYSWSPAQGLSSTTVANPVFTPRSAGVYTLTVTAINTDKCTRTSSVTINVVDVRCGPKNNMVMVCHEGMINLCISPNAVADHLSHGDVLGNCDTPASAALEGVNLKAMPNPFSNSTTFEFVMEEEGNYLLELRNRDGILMTVLAKGISKAGEVHSVEFNRGDLPDGIYYGRLITDKTSKFVRIMLAR